MRLKELESLMQDIAAFANPKVELEQYPTGAHLASRLLYTVASSFDEFAGQTVVDLGCGTAMLSIGAAMLGACHVIGVDVDDDALHVASANVDEYEQALPIDFVRCDVRQLAGTQQPYLLADTVIMNPPFGTRQRGADMDFLRAAFRVSLRSVYSLHKSSTRDHVGRVARRELGAASAEVLAKLRYDLPASYSFHRAKSRDIEVDLWRFEVRRPEADVGFEVVRPEAAGPRPRRQPPRRRGAERNEVESDETERSESAGSESGSEGEARKSGEQGGRAEHGRL